jgi:hypothetical protein
MGVVSMSRLSKETLDYLNQYSNELIMMKTKDADLYLTVLNAAINVTEDESELFELISFGNEYVTSHKDSEYFQKYHAQAKHRLGIKILNHYVEMRQLVEVPYGLFKKPAADPYKAYERKEIRDKVKNAFNNLSDKQKVAVKDIVMNKETFTSTARKLNVTPEMAFKLAKRGVNRIRLDREVAYYRWAEDDFMTGVLDFSEKYKEEKSKTKGYKKR